MLIKLFTEQPTNYQTVAKQENFIIFFLWYGMRSDYVQKDNTYKLICYNKTARKFCYITYMAYIRHLPTSDRLIAWGMNVDPHVNFVKGIMRPINVYLQNVNFALIYGSRCCPSQISTKQLNVHYNINYPFCAVALQLNQLYNNWLTLQWLQPIIIYGWKWLGNDLRRKADRRSKDEN